METLLPCFAYISTMLMLLPWRCVWSRLNGPKTSVVMSGTNITLQCSTTKDNPYWTWHVFERRIVDGSGCNLISYALRDKFLANVTDHGSCHLLIINITFSDAGQYSCSDSPTTPKMAVANLIVIGKNVKCSSSQPFEKIARHEDIIKLSCSLEYNDTTASNMPQLSWSTEVEDFMTHFEPPNLAVNKIEKKIIELASDLHPILPSQKCSASMKRFQLPAEFEATCETNPISVFYPPRDLKIILPTSRYIRPGDEVICVANSNPSSLYVWRTGDTESVYGQSIIIQKSGKYNCTAHNTINGKLFNQSVSADIFVDNSLPIVSAILITITVTALALIIIYGIVFCIKIDFRVSVIV